MGTVFKLLLGGILLLNIFNFASPLFALENTENNDRIVTVVDGHKETTFATDAPTVIDALDRAGVPLSSDDKVEPEYLTELDDKTNTITIERARPVVVRDETSRKVLLTHEQDAARIAEEADVIIYPGDEVKLQRISNVVEEGTSGEKLVIDRARPVTPEMEAKARKPIKVLRQDEQKVAHTTREVQDPNLDNGVRKVQTQGKPGVRIVTYEVEMLKYKEVSRKVIRSEIIEPPVEHVIIVGTRPSPTGNRALGKQMMLERGFAESEWSCLETLWTRESNWRENAHNPSSGAHGIPQALPATKMASHGSDYMTNPKTQIAWGLDYIKNRYGTPCKALSFWNSHNWY